MRSSARILVAAGFLALGLVGGCGAPAPAEPGVAAVSVVVSDAATGEVGAVELDVPGGATLALEPPGEDGAWTGSFAVPGSDASLDLVARARGASGEVLRSAAVTVGTQPSTTPALAVDLAAAITAPVPTAPGKNKPPTINALWISDTTVQPGSTLSMSVTASDKDGDPLSYQWTSSCGGTFSAPTRASTSWQAPGVQTSCKLTVTVSDGRGGVATGSVAVTVAWRRTGSVVVRATLNAAPLVDVVADAPLAPYTPPLRQSLRAYAHDPDGAATSLSYAWTVPAGSACPGTFSPATGAATTFAPAASVPAGARCTAQVTVSDARGGSNRGTVTFPVGVPPVWTGPALVAASQSQLVAGPGDRVILDAQFAASDGSTPAVTWTSAPSPLGLGPGSPSTATFPPACVRGATGATVPTAYQIVATARDARGFTGSALFAVTFCP
jgi:hypothetical protein